MLSDFGNNGIQTTRRQRNINQQPIPTFLVAQIVVTSPLYHSNQTKKQTRGTNAPNQATKNKHSGVNTNALFK